MENQIKMDLSLCSFLGLMFLVVFVFLFSIELLTTGQLSWKQYY